MDRPIYVYSCYCEHNGLLYVGVASHLERRLGEHRRKDWWPEVTLVVADLYSSKREAHAVERRRIWHDHPMHNRVGFNSMRTPCEYEGLPTHLETTALSVEDGRVYA